jgi:hypothetical protein
MQAELQLAGDAEIAAPATKRPEQLVVRVRAGMDHRAIGGHDLGAEQVVAGQAVLRGQVADSAAEGETGHTRRAHHATRRDEAEGLGRGVEVEPGRAALRPGDPCLAVHFDAAHQREVDHEPAVEHAVTGRIVATAPHGHLEAVRPGVVEGCRHVGGAEAADDHRRPAVDERVEAAARSVIAGVAGPDDGPSHHSAQLAQALDSRAARLGLFAHRIAFLTQHRGCAGVAKSRGGTPPRAAGYCSDDRHGPDRPPAGDVFTRPANSTGRS